MSLNDRLAMIRTLRRFTIFLGKLGIRCLVRNWVHFDQDGVPYDTTIYGYGLKECKDAVDGYLERREQKARLSSIT